MTEKSYEFRSGFSCFVGRPNTGKSTLTNALVGEKIAITSNRSQTTRHIIRGVVNRQDAQLILVDTPGLHRPRTLLGQRLNDLVRSTYSAVDIVCMCVPADEAIGSGDRRIIQQVRAVAPETVVIGVVTKIDRATPGKIADQLMELSLMLGEHSEVVPVSAKSGQQLDVLVDILVSKMETGPAFYDDGEFTDEPEQILMAEFIREAALESVRDELPHSLAVVIDEIIPRENPGTLISEANVSGSNAPRVLDIYAILYVERDSQKGIIIGNRGSRLKVIGTQARQQIERLLGCRIYLNLRVKVAKDWQRDPKQLRRMGF